MSAVSKHDDTWKKKHSETLKKKWEDPEYRRLHSGIYAPTYGKKGISLTGSDNGNAKSVVCLNTRKEYGCIKDAAIDTGASQTGIGECCHGRSKTAGIGLDGSKLLWVFKSDFETMTNKEIEDRLAKSNKRHGRLIVNVTNNELFTNATLAAEKYNVKNPCSINTSCRERKYKVKKCIWVYYEDYLKENNLTDEEARKSLFFVA